MTAASGKLRQYTILEEIIHATSHGLAAIAAVVGLCFLIAKAVAAGGALEITAAVIYGSSVLLVFALSTLYHSMVYSKRRDLYELLDHVAIYAKIAGTYTPIALLVLSDTLGLWVLVLVWCAAAAGATAKVIGFATGHAEGKVFRAISLGTYLAMGWGAVAFAGELYERLPGAGLGWIVAGGLLYTVGAIFYALKGRRFTHAIWHGFVVLGSIAHFIAIYAFVLPRVS